MTLSPASVRNVMPGSRTARAHLCAPHLRGPAADRNRAALFRRCPDADRGSNRERPAERSKAKSRAAGKRWEGVLNEGVRPALRPEPIRPALCSAPNRTPGSSISNSCVCEPERALVVLVAEDGQVENCILSLPRGSADVRSDRGVELPERAYARQDADGIKVDLERTLGSCARRDRSS